MAVSHSLMGISLSKCTWRDSSQWAKGSLHWVLLNRTVDTQEDTDYYSTRLILPGCDVQNYSSHFKTWGARLRLRPTCWRWLSRIMAVPGVLVTQSESLRLFVTPWTGACQALLSLGFSRQGYWGGLPFPSPGDLPDAGIKPGAPALQAASLPSEPPGKPASPWGLRLYLKHWINQPQSCIL